MLTEDCRQNVDLGGGAGGGGVLHTQHCNRLLYLRVLPQAYSMMHVCHPRGGSRTPPPPREWAAF